MSEEKKIIVDEDWKSQVAREKEEADRRAAEAAAKEGPQPEPDAASDSGAADKPQGRESRQLPPASFEMLVTMLATEAMAGLGQLPNPMTGKAEAEPEQARYAIDMLDVLASKTKGNLTPAEETGLRDLLHQLRMAFVALQSQTASDASPAGDDA